MSQRDQREAVASLLMEHIKGDEVTKIEELFSHFSQDSQWRDIVRCEFSIEELLGSTLLYDVVIPRLLSYEIKTLSPIHYASFRGRNDILINFIEHDVPVDVSLSSGATPLHLAAFGGKSETVRMLVDVYKADINKQDHYGWSALHYCGTEGHNEVVTALVDLGINISLRDQDGTSAAFRAQVNGYEDIVDTLCELEDDLLNVDPAYEGRDFATQPAAEAVYSQVKPKWASKGPVTNPESEKKASATAKDPEKVRSQTLPRNFFENKTSTIRRIIQKELENAMAQDPDYMTPSDFSKSGKPDDPENDQFALAGIGVNTLKGIMREELGKYTREMFQRAQSTDSGLLSPPAAAPVTTKSSHSPDYEDIRELVKHFDQQVDSGAGNVDEPPKEAPPLPPRNQDAPRSPDPVLTTGSHSNGGNHDDQTYLLLQNFSSRSDNVALKESVKRIGPILGENWKKLASALPLCKSQQSLHNRVVAIEKRYPGDRTKQASAALDEWLVSEGRTASVDDLVLALRKCGLTSLVNDVQSAAQEFTA